MMNKECLSTTYEIKNNVLKCKLCPHNCKIPEGMSGKCKIRENKSQNLFLSNYGQVVCAKIDTISSRPIYYYKSENIKDRNEKSLSIGLTGCNNFCPFCQNYEISQVKSYRESTYLSPKEVVKKAIENNVKCISFTFSEPIVWMEYMIDCVKEIDKIDIKSKKRKIDVLLKTAGYISPPYIKYIERNVDAINLDIKPLNEEYLKKCGIQNHIYVEKFLKKLYKKKHVEISHIIIEGINDKKEEIDKFLNTIKRLASLDIPIHLLRHYPSWKSQYPVTKEETMDNVYRYIVNSGFSRVHKEKIE